MAKVLDADSITTDFMVVRKIDSSVRIISVGETLKYPGFRRFQYH